MFFLPPILAGVLHPADKLTDDEKVSLVRDLTAEYAKAKDYIPRSKTPLEIEVDGTWDKRKWQMDAQKMGGPAHLLRIHLPFSFVPGSVDFDFQRGLRPRDVILRLCVLGREIAHERDLLVVGEFIRGMKNAGENRRQKKQRPDQSTGRGSLASESSRYARPLRKGIFHTARNRITNTAEVSRLASGP